MYMKVTYPNRDDSIARFASGPGCKPLILLYTAGPAGLLQPCSACSGHRNHTADELFELFDVDEDGKIDPHSFDACSIWDYLDLILTWLVISHVLFMLQPTRYDNGPN